MSNTKFNSPPTTFDYPEILRMRDAAKYLGVSKAHLYKLIARGDFRKVKLGVRAAGMRRGDLNQWISSKQVG